MSLGALGVAGGGAVGAAAGADGSGAAAIFSAGAWAVVLAASSGAGRSSACATPVSPGLSVSAAMPFPLSRWQRVTK
jgi:hypothetical protein